MKAGLRSVGKALAEKTQGAAASAVARLSTAGAPAARQRLLVLSDGLEYTSEQQLAPLRRYQLLLARHGITFTWRHVDSVTSGELSLRDVDAVLLKLSFRTPQAQVRAVLDGLIRLRGAGATPKLIYCDGDDDLCVQWSFVTDAVDLYLKKHMFSDERRYFDGRVGKTNLTDHVAASGAFDFSEDFIAGVAAPGPDFPVSKLALSWNIGFDDKILDLQDQLAAMPPVNKEIDVLCRSYVAPEVWTYTLRSKAIEAVERLPATVVQRAPRDRVSQQAYYDELRKSRICVSPFGFGELCWRDFEAVLCSSLLVKADMGHVKTWPDIFRPFETYVPVRWDYADLEEKCLHYLQRPDELDTIVRNARQALQACLSGEAFVERLRGLLA